MRNGKYELVIPPPEYPGKRYRGRYAYQHHVVWWQETGQLVREGNVLHHRDDQKRRNVIGNLEEKTRSKHTIDHKASGRTMASLVCDWCGIAFERERRLCPLKQERFYCCRSHQVRGQQKRLAGTRVVAGDRLLTD